MAFVITETKEAPGPGWCALNSAHVISTADVIGWVPAVGWVCPGCLASAADDR